MEITYYLDDIIIYSSSWEQYHEGIPTLFQKLQEAKLTVNMKNSNLFRTYFRFLGHIVSFPINIKGDQRFPCMAGSYYQIVPNFSTTVWTTEWIATQRMYVRLLFKTCLVSPFIQGHHRCQWCRPGSTSLEKRKYWGIAVILWIE